MNRKLKYRYFSFQPIRLYHDVKNYGLRIFYEKEKIIYITDTKTVEGIVAKDYDLYDLLTFEAKNAVVTFDYGVTNHTLKIFENDGEVVYQFYQKWFHGAEEFLEKARISRNRITTVNEQISNISVTQASNDSRLL